MHEGAYKYIANTVTKLEPRCTVIELGSRTVAGDWPYSGPVRPLFTAASHYAGVDIVPGPNVDVVADAATWPVLEPRDPPWPFDADTVVCCETLEHTPDAEAICANAHRLLKTGGVFLCTAAGEGRAPHSATDGGPLRDSVCEVSGMRITEFYRNVTRDDMRSWLKPFGFALIDTSTAGDIYALAVKVR